MPPPIAHARRPLAPPVGPQLVGCALFFAAAVPALPALAQAPLGWAGDGSSALPAIRRVGVPASTPEAAGVSGEAGYGFTETIYGENGDHHRASGSIAGSVRPLPWLAFWLRADGRYDAHPADDLGPDDGFVGVPRIGARVAGTIDPAFSLGLELELVAPGGDAPSIVGEALSFEARALAAFRPTDAVTVGVMAGFRLDNSAATVPRPSPYRLGDQIALGASDFHAFIAGIGVVWLLAPVELFAELTLDVLVLGRVPDGYFNESPGFAQFPFRASAGGRLHLARGVAVELGLDLSASAERPPVGEYKALVPVEPRLSVYAALRIALPLFEDPAANVEPDAEARVQPELEPEPERARVSGRVLDDRGAPLAGARVTLAPSEGVVLEALSDAGGAFFFEQVPIGAATLRVEADEHHPSERAVDVVRGENTLTEPLALGSSVPRGQLRGMIRSYDGRPLVARILVENLGLEGQTDAEGFFELDVAPGEHVVIIEAPSHRGQRRTVEVPDNGVTVLNVDLRRGRSR